MKVSQVLGFVFATAVTACASAPPSRPAPVVAIPKPATEPVAVASAPQAPLPKIARSRVREALVQGPGVLLARVELDEMPVFRAGKFHGFRIAGLLGEPGFWKGVDLKPGDVVTAVNGFGVERPEQAYEAFRSLDVASELAIDYERNGEKRSLRYEIEEDLPEGADGLGVVPLRRGAKSAGAKPMPKAPTKSLKK
jgi:hypothetical protein